LKRKRVLVTGGAGFIGSHLCDKLLERGHHVTCMDNFFTGRRENVERLLHNSRFELIRHDITFPFTIEVQEIYHLACPASPRHYQLNPVRTIRTGVIGTANVLDAARDARARVLLASTSEVYGDPLVHPQSENDWGNVNPIGPRACYDESKRCAEALVTAYVDQYGMEARIARIFNTYGPRLTWDDGRVVSNFIVNALRGERLEIYGDGKQTRSFCFVSDMVKGLIALMEADVGHRPVNLGNPVEVTVAEMAQTIVRLCGSRSTIHVEPPLPDEPRRRKPNIARARELLDWEPTVDLDDGLKATIEYFQYWLAMDEVARPS
jgi:UDP-glucuronate decarboxylase